MGFEKGNTYGKGRVSGSKNKKTIFRESLNLLNEVGINPISSSKELIDSLLEDKELKNSEKINLLSTLTNLWKYEMLTRVEEVKLIELTEENEDLKEENKELTDFVGSPQDLLKKLKKDKEDN